MKSEDTENITFMCIYIFETATSVVVFCTSTSAELKAKGGFITAAKAGSNKHGQVKKPLPSPLDSRVIKPNHFNTCKD
jgi:hypothetical protein